MISLLFLYSRNPHKLDPSKGEDEALLIKKYDGVHGYQILDVAISDDNSKFASCGGDKVCFMWDISSGKVMRRFQGHTQRINAVQMNEEASLLFRYNQMPFHVILSFKL